MSGVRVSRSLKLDVSSVATRQYIGDENTGNVVPEVNKTLETSTQAQRKVSDACF